MSATHVVVEGTLKPDGSLELDSKLNLPPGRVQLIVQPLPELPKDDPFWQMMQRIWAARTAAELTPRGTEEVEAQRRALREDVEARLLPILAPRFPLRAARSRGRVALA